MRLVLFVLATFVLRSQPAGDPQDLLARARSRLLETVGRLPHYTCTQTIRRDRFERTVPWSRCDVPASRSPDTKQHVSRDRLRLDVAVTASGREIYSWAGAGRFESERIRDLVPTGAVATGSFGPFLIDIFNNRGATFARDGEEAFDGRTLARFRFRVPRSASHYRFQTGGGHQIVAYDGAFWLDPDSAELVRLQVHSDGMPHDTGTCEATNTMTFLQVPIGEGEFLLPRSSRVEFATLPGHSVNAIEYSACKQYRAESTIHFGPSNSQARGTAHAVLPRRTAVPRSLGVSLVLETAIDTETSAAGDVVAARVGKDVVESRSKRVLIPAGAIVRGRITLLEHQLTGPPYFQIAIRWDTLEAGGSTQAFAAMLDAKAGYLKEYVIDVKELAAERRDQVPKLPSRYPVSAGRTLVFPSSQPNYVVPRGFVSSWVTVTAK